MIAWLLMNWAVAFLTLLLLANLPRPTLVAVEKASGKIGFFTASGKLVSEVEIGGHPHEMAISSDGRYLFTTDNGVMLMTEKTDGGNSSSIVDLVERKKVGVIDLGPHRRPHGIDFDPSTGHVLVTTELPSKLLILDPARKAVVDTYDIGGKAPHMVRLAPDHRTAWISCTDTGTVTALDLQTRAFEQILVGARPQGIEFSPDFRRLYVANSDGYSVTVIDTTTKKVVGEIPLGSAHSGPVRVIPSRDGKVVIAALQPDHAIAFADASTLKQTKILPLPGPPVSMTLSADGKLAYCSVQDLDTVFVVSLARRTILRSFKTPPHSGPDPVLPIPAPANAH